MGEVVSTDMLDWARDLVQIRRMFAVGQAVETSAELFVDNVRQFVLPPGPGVGHAA